MIKILIIESPLTGVQVQVEGAAPLQAVGVIEVAKAIMLSAFKVQAQPVIKPTSKNKTEEVQGG